MHLFSLHYTETSRLKKSVEFFLKDPDICRRIIRVLRLRVGQELVLFDRGYNSTVRIETIQKDGSVCLYVLNVQSNQIYTPAITFLLPLLKRDAFEDALSGLVAAGIQSIQLVMTDGVQRKWQGDREQDRLNKIVIAAAEQSRNYSFPLLEKPISLEKALDLHVTGKTFCVYANPESPSICALKNDVVSFKPNNILLTVGPEADFSASEKELFLKKNVYSYRLTPTILRSSLAAILLAGMCRSVLP